MPELSLIVRVAAHRKRDAEKLLGVVSDYADEQFEAYTMEHGEPMNMASWIEPTDERDRFQHALAAILDWYEGLRHIRWRPADLYQTSVQTFAEARKMMGKKRMGYCMGVPIDVEVAGYIPPQATEDWQRCCLAYQGDSVPCNTPCLHCHRMAEVVAAEREKLCIALRDLVDACSYVSPISGAVATTASVKDIRNAGKFMKAVENAQKLLGNSKLTPEAKR